MRDLISILFYNSNNTFMPFKRFKYGLKTTVINNNKLSFDDIFLWFLYSLSNVIDYNIVIRPYTYLLALIQIIFVLPKGTDVQFLKK